MIMLMWLLCVSIFDEQRLFLHQRSDSGTKIGRSDGEISGTLDDLLMSLYKQKQDKG